MKLTGPDAIPPVFCTTSPSGRRCENAKPVRVDLEDKDDEFVLTAELPGFDEDDIDVRVTDRTLRLEAEHAEETEEEGEYVKRERHRVSVARSISLPEAVEVDDFSATFNNGVLTVHLPKNEPVTQGKQVEIS